jgi:hypothetical protein
MSRDPLDPQLGDSNGIPTDPAYLQKYLYANGDPINGVDPTGHGDSLITTAFLLQKAVAVVGALGTCGGLSVVANMMAADALAGKPVSRLEKDAFVFTLVTCVGAVAAILL